MSSPSGRSSGADPGVRAERVLVIVPAYNEEGRIEHTLAGIARSFPQADVAVVNDRSVDRTGQIAASLGARVLTHPLNLGYGGAVQTGLKYAVENNYGTAVLIDADGQHDPRAIPVLIQALKDRDADVVIGSRYLDRGFGAFPSSFARKVGTILFSALTSLLLRRRISDTTSGFQALNRRAARFLAKYYPRDFPDADVVVLLILFGFKLVEVPVTMRPREDGVSMHSGLSSMVYYPFRMVLGIFLSLLRRVFSRKEMSPYVH